jgi:hypothetical protein
MKVTRPLLRGYVPSQQFREAVLQALDLVAVHQAKGWISDDRLLGAVRPRDLDWGFAAVVPRVAELGLRRFAHLESEDALNRRTIAGAIQPHEPEIPFEFRRFTDLVEARAWALGITSLA